MPFLRKYNTLLVTGTTSIRIPIIKRGVVDFAVGADWTPAAGDVKVFTDAVAVANITNLPTAIASGNTAQWEFILTAAELSGKQVLVMVADAAAKAVEDQAFIVETFGHASAMYPADFSDGVRLGLTALPAAAADAAGGLPISDAGGLDMDAILSRMGTPADLGGGATLAANLSDIEGQTDDIGAAGAGLTAITGKTNSLTFTVAGLVDANMLRLNGVAASAAALEKSASVIYSGQVSGATSVTTLIDSGLTQADVDHWKGRIIIFLDGTLKYQATDITAFDPTTDKLTFTAVTTAPTAGPGGSLYVIV